MGCINFILYGIKMGNKQFYLLITHLTFLTIVTNPYFKSSQGFRPVCFLNAAEKCEIEE